MFSDKKITLLLKIHSVSNNRYFLVYLLHFSTYFLKVGKGL
ncbi:hypothetical protein [uncultured Gammaproteobacteria bacterium]|nr:hypothetical protein [uncultured Gammaproteobacteria bacterium]